MEKFAFGKVLCGELSDFSVVARDARHVDFWSADGEVHERNIALHQFFYAAKCRGVGSQGGEDAVAVPGERRMAETVVKYQVPAVFFCIPCNAEYAVGTHRADHCQYIMRLHRSILRNAIANGKCNFYDKLCTMRTRLTSCIIHLMKFLCICLSPAIDATVRMGAWPMDGMIIKNAVDTFSPGGKAVNVARWLAKRGATVACGGLLGEDNAAMFEKELGRYGIEDRFVRTPGSTRINEMFVTPQGSFKVNRSANGKFDGLEKFEGFNGFDVVIISGSLPKEWPEDTYCRLVASAKQAGAKVVLDASGAALVEGVKAHPEVIKPNAEECEALVGFVPKTADDFMKATTALKAFCDYPIISDGGNGCWFDGKFIPAPKVKVLDTTAAGDTLLAEWCWQTFGLRSRPDGCSWAVAAGSAACAMPGGEPPDIALVEKLVKEENR